MFDAFVMVECYCNLLIELVALIENQKLFFLFFVILVIDAFLMAEGSLQPCHFLLIL